MNTIKLAAVVIALLGNVGWFARSEITSTRSPAEMRAELAQVLAAGSRLSQGESSGG